MLNKEQFSIPKHIHQHPVIKTDHQFLIKRSVWPNSIIKIQHCCTWHTRPCLIISATARLRMSLVQLLHYKKVESRINGKKWKEKKSDYADALNTQRRVSPRHQKSINTEANNESKTSQNRQMKLNGNGKTTYCSLHQTVTRHRALANSAPLWHPSI